MSDISGDQERITQAEEDEAFLMGQMAQSTGDYFALLGRDEEAKAEYLAAIAVYNQILSSFSGFTEFHNNKQNLLKNISDLQEKLKEKLSEPNQIGERIIKMLTDNEYFTSEVDTSVSLVADTVDRSVEFMINPEPRCPVVLLLDTSGSMSGKPIEALNRGLAVFKEILEQDKIASMRVEVAIITFGYTHLIQDFVTVDKVIIPRLVADGGTPMGRAIELALDLLESRKRKYRENYIEYYKPWIFLVTDGQPTDSWENAARRVRYAGMNNKFSFFAVGMPSANMNILRDISPPNTPPMLLNHLNFKSMFTWISFSLKQVSTSRIGETIKLPPVGWGEVAI